MPFCIIFFVLTILNILMFKKLNFKNILVVICLILLIVSVFTPSVIVYKKLYLNVFFVIATILFQIVLFTYRNKKFWLVTLVACIKSIGYFIGVQTNIFLSIDYNYYFALIIPILFILFYCKNKQKVIYFCFNYVIGIVVVDCIFWWKELQYININYINLYNLFSILLATSFFCNFIYNKIIIRRNRYEKIH